MVSDVVLVGKVHKPREILTWRMHDAAHHETTRSTASQMQRRTFLHSQVLHQSPLRKKIGGQLYRTSKTRPYHRSTHTSIESRNTLPLINLPHPIQGIPISMLSPYRCERRETLQSRLNQKERAARGSAQNARRRAREYINSQTLCGWIGVYCRCQRMSYRFIESQSTSIEDHLVDVCCTDSAVDSFDSFVAHNYGNAVEGSFVHSWL